MNYSRKLFHDDPHPSLLPGEKEFFMIFFIGHQYPRAREDFGTELANLYSQGLNDIQSLQ